MPGAIENAAALLQRVDLRVYRPEDRDDVLAFRCAPHGDKWCEAAEELIHKATDHLSEFADEYPFFVLARDNGELVGAIIFGLEHPEDPAVQIFTLGVALSRQREGFGTLLEKIAMAVAASEPDWPSAVISSVHRRNYRMNGLNDNIGIARNKDPEDGEFFVTGATVELVVDGTDFVRVAEPPEV